MITASSLDGSDVMVQVLAATFKDGVFKPDQKPALSESTRVRLVVESIDPKDESARRDESWDQLQLLWNTSSFNSGGDRLNREKLHERD
jgi:predicted DNA-binding antitoxin AbrB/MazE fold protein